MLSQQDQEMRRNVPDPSFAGGSHLCGSGAGNETILDRREHAIEMRYVALLHDDIINQPSLAYI